MASFTSASLVVALLTGLSHVDSSRLNLYQLEGRAEAAAEAIKVTDVARAEEAAEDVATVEAGEATEATSAAELSVATQATEANAAGSAAGAVSSEKSGMWPFSDGEPESCDFPCGAQTAHYRITETEEIVFEVGTGDGSSQLPETKCLTKCVVTESLECGAHDSDFTQYSRDARGRNLCCEELQCNYHPESSTWEDPAIFTEDQYAPLQSLDGMTEVEARTCLCCSRQEEAINWGAQMKEHCMLGYDTTWKSTMSMSGQSNCNAFCEAYLSYPFGAYDRKSHSLQVYTNNQEYQEQAAVLALEDGKNGAVRAARFAIAPVLLLSSLWAARS